MKRRTVGLAVLGGVAGAVAAGAAAGTVLERLVIGRQRLQPDPEASEDFGRLPGRASTVTAEDGVRLHVEEVGTGPLTVVFVHGFALSSPSWHYQRRDLADAARLVFYDHRSHGRSDRAPDASCTIEQLGRDLATVLETVAPQGPVVLVGHSMGGMTIMSLAEHRPDLFGTKVIGVALIGTSAGELTEALLRLPVRLIEVAKARVLPLVHTAVGRAAPGIERRRPIGSDLSFAITKWWGFGANPSPAQVEFAERMTSATPVDVINAFTPTLSEHARYEALGVLSRVPVLVLVGEGDRLTPRTHSDEIARRVASAQYVVVDGAAHMVMLERAPLVNLHLRAFLRRATRAAKSEARGA